MSVFKDILIDDIPEEGLELTCSEAEAWFHDILVDALGNAFGEGDKARGVVRISRFEGNVNVDGEVELLAHPACDRCLEPYAVDKKIKFHTVLAPLYENRRHQKREDDVELELVKEDLEFQFYEGDRFDLAEVIREQIVLDEPMKHLCREGECKGLCQRCGKNLNDGACGCDDETANSAFAALKGIRVLSKLKD
jgi:uncharacterized protein